ncbi:MAG: DUF4129 domain-containing protein [Thermoflexales bacterium]|nr:DUF4129 domain-containing protein [Thermoflexales bacterium]
MTPEQELERLRQILARMNPTVAPPPPNTPVRDSSPLPDVSFLVTLGNIILVVVAVVAIALVLAAVVAFLRGRIRREKTVAASSTPQTDAVLVEATQHADDGDMREAMRKLYLATLTLLDERGILILDPSRTNREILRALGSRPALQDSLLPVVDTFDPVWYGHKPLVRERFDAFKANIETARQLSEPAPAPVPAGGRA